MIFIGIDGDIYKIVYIYVCVCVLTIFFKSVFFNISFSLTFKYIDEGKAEDSALVC